jgi:hypothetical protein
MRPRGRPVLGGVSGLFLGALGSLALQQYSVRPLNIVRTTGLSLFGLCIGVTMGWTALLSTHAGRKRRIVGAGIVSSLVLGSGIFSQSVHESTAGASNAAFFPSFPGSPPSSPSASPSTAVDLRVALRGGVLDLYTGSGHYHLFLQKTSIYRVPPGYMSMFWGDSGGARFGIQGQSFFGTRPTTTPGTKAWKRAPLWTPYHLPFAYGVTTCSITIKQRGDRTIAGTFTCPYFGQGDFTLSAWHSLSAARPSG